MIVSKRIELQIECNIIKSLGSLSWTFAPFPTIGIKRLGKAVDEEVLLYEGETSFHLVWLFFELIVIIKDKQTI